MKKTNSTLQNKLFLLSFQGINFSLKINMVISNLAPQGVFLFEIISIKICISKSLRSSLLDLFSTQNAEIIQSCSNLLSKGLAQGSITPKANEH